MKATIKHALLAAMLLASVSIAIDSPSSISFSDVADEDADDLPRTLSHSAPWWCHGRDCPDFEEEDKGTWKNRKFKAATWVSTDINKTSHCVSTATLIGYWRLSRYMHGKNDQSLTMMMTTPVLTRVTSNKNELDEEGHCCVRNYTVSFFIPFAYQENTPKPTSSNVYLDCQDTTEMAVLEYSGYPSGQRVADKLDALERVLTEAEIPFCNKTYWSAVYDPPHRLHQRHNEVWLAVSSEKKQPTAAPLTPSVPIPVTVPTPPVLPSSSSPLPVPGHQREHPGQVFISPVHPQIKSDVPTPVSVPVSVPTTAQAPEQPSISRKGHSSQEPLQREQQQQQLHESVSTPPIPAPQQPAWSQPQMPPIIVGKPAVV